MEPDYLIKMPFINSKGASTLGHTFRYVHNTPPRIYTHSLAPSPRPPPPTLDLNR